MRWEGKEAKAIEIAVARLAKVLTRNPDGSVGLGWYGDFNNCVTALARRAGVSPEVPEDQRLHIIRTAVVDAFKAGELTATGIGGRIGRAELAYLATRPRRFVMVSSVSVSYDKRITPVVFDGARIAFAWHTPSRFTAPDLFRQDRHGGRDRQPQGYSSVRISVTARCVESASEAAFERFDLLRAIWNLWYNHRRYSVGRSAHRPYNDIVPGPVQTLHAPTGEPATDTYWYDPSYTERHHTKRIADDYDGLRRFERRVRAAVARSPLGAHLRRLLLRYGRALDERNPANAFLQLWGVLEEATRTSERDSHETTVRRASFLWADPEFYRLVLDDLRLSRNTLVHEGREPRRANDNVEELRHFVEALILFLAQQPRRFHNLGELVEFLSFPPDAEELSRRSRSAARAARFRRTADEAADED